MVGIWGWGLAGGGGPIPRVAPAGLSFVRHCTQIVRNSLDHGGPWGDEIVLAASYPMHDGGVGGGLELDNGDLLFPRNGLGMLISKDQGKRWTFGGRLAHEGESQAAELSNGSVIMQMRDSGKYRYVWCRSDDGGATFSGCHEHSSPLGPDVPPSILGLGSPAVP